MVGLGRAFALTAPAIAAHPGVVPVAAAAPRAESRDAFRAAFGGRVYAEVADLAADPEVEAVYVTTPHGMHLDHALTAIRAGKHVLVEKPMAVSLGDACAMVRAARAAGVTLIVGPSHSFDGPVKLAADLIAAGAIGGVRMIHALYATDFLYRPRRADELSTDLGGGVVFSQAIHQVDLVRRLAGGRAVSVYARTGGAWDPARPTEGAYAMMIDFADGAFASLTYSGYAHVDGDRLMEGVSELGVPKPAAHRAARAALSAAPDEAAAKRARGFATLAECPVAETHEHFGQVLVFGERGDLRLTPGGVEVTDDRERRFHPAPFRTTRAEVFDTLHAALRAGVPPLQSGVWGRASLEICHALLASARTGRPQGLVHQGETA
ncbi:MAG: Gfo/Idh/MocA family oxidoreductase [Rhodobacteraceae bacterium]|nr:Gfo/Idh/MocA family oxidoreductase [Paracoccaceae bacterium]